MNTLLGGSVLGMNAVLLSFPLHVSQKCQHRALEVPWSCLQRYDRLLGEQLRYSDKPSCIRYFT